MVYLRNWDKFSIVGACLSMASDEAEEVGRSKYEVPKSNFKELGLFPMVTEKHWSILIRYVIISEFKRSSTNFFFVFQVRDSKHYKLAD